MSNVASVRQRLFVATKNVHQKEQSSGVYELMIRLMAGSKISVPLCKLGTNVTCNFTFPPSVTPPQQDPHIRHYIKFDILNANGQSLLGSKPIDLSDLCFYDYKIPGMFLSGDEVLVIDCSTLMADNWRNFLLHFCDFNISEQEKEASKWASKNENTPFEIKYKKVWPK